MSVDNLNIHPPFPCLTTERLLHDYRTYHVGPHGQEILFDIDKVIYYLTKELLNPGAIRPHREH